MLLKVNREGESLPDGHKFSVGLDEILSKDYCIPVQAEFLFHDFDEKKETTLHIWKARTEFVKAETVEDTVYLDNFIHEAKERKVILVLNMKKSFNARNLFDACLFDGESFSNYFRDISKANNRNVFVPLLLQGFKDGTFSGYEMEMVGKKVFFYMYQNKKRKQIRSFLSLEQEAAEFANTLLKGGFPY